MNSTVRSLISLGLLSAVAVIGGYYVHQNWTEVAALKVVSPWLIGVVAGSFVVSVLLRGLFTLAVLRSLGTRLTFAESFALSMVGTMANNLLPVRTGVGIRGLYLKRVHQLPLAHFASTMGTFYLFNLLVASLLGLLALIALAMSGGGLRKDLLILLLLLAVACTGSILLSPTLPARLQGRIADFFRRVAEGWSLIRRSPMLLTLALMSSLGASLFAAIGFYAGFYAMGYATSFAATVLLTASYAVGGLVALTPGGIGFQEAVGVYFGSVVSLSTVELLSILLVVRVIRVLTSVVVGLPCLWRLRRRSTPDTVHPQAITLGRRLARALSFTLSPIEGFFFGTPTRRYPPVFIVGLPRSGSTLLYQTMCHCFEVAYSSRLTRYLWFAPALAAWWIRRTRGPYTSDFQSHYGKGRDWAMPYDATIMWNLWFGKDAFLEADGGTARARAAAQHYVARSEALHGGPFLERNLRCNQWLPALVEIFPDAVFLISLRDPKSVALSLLRGRMERFGDVTQWLLIRPRTPAPFALECPEDEVVYQVWGIVEDLRTDMARIGASHFACVDYGALCQDPSAYMEAIAALLSQRSVPMHPRQSAPPAFEPSTGRTDSISPEQEKRIDSALVRYFPSGTFEPLPCVSVDVS